MTLDEVIIHFGSGYRLCKVLGIRRQNYTQWKRKGGIPLLQQARIENVTGGKLKADYEDFEK